MDVISGLFASAGVFYVLKNSYSFIDGIRNKRNYRDMNQIINLINSGILKPTPFTYEHDVANFDSIGSDGDKIHFSIISDGSFKHDNKTRKSNSLFMLNGKRTFFDTSPDDITIIKNLQNRSLDDEIDEYIAGRLAAQLNKPGNYSQAQAKR